METQERCLILLKPDVIERNLFIPITGFFAFYDLYPSDGWIFTELNEDVIRRLYPHIVNEVFFSKEFIPYMTRNKVIYAIFHGLFFCPNITNYIMDIVGNKTDPKENDKMTLRKILGKSKLENTIHRSDSAESAEREIKIIEEYEGIKIHF